MKKIKLTQGKYALVDDADFEMVSKFKWSYDPKGYAFTNFGKRPHRRVLFLHRFIMGEPKDKECDHINNDKLDNRRENLRICTRFENSCNRKLFKNITGYKGVYYDKKYDRLLIAGKSENDIVAGSVRILDVILDFNTENKVIKNTDQMTTLYS